MRFDAEDASQKAACKGALQKQVGLDVDVATPLMLVAGPLTGAPGRSIADLLTQLLDYPVSVVVAMQPGDETEITNRVCNLAQECKSRLATLPLSSNQPYSPALGAADLVLLGSAISPLCTTHLYALRYGAVPIADITGYYSDQLIDCDAKLETGNSFAFGSWNTTEVAGAVSRAISAWSQPGFERLRRRIMRQDLGWERPTRRTIQVYRQVLGIKV
jgi:starch synthase